MRLAAGIEPSAPLTVSAISNAQKSLAIDLLYGQINAGTTPPSYLDLEMETSPNLFPTTAHPGPKWHQNSCFFDSALHIFLYLYRWEPSHWWPEALNTLRSQLGTKFREYWSIIADFCNSTDASEEERRSIGRAQATAWRDSMLRFLREYPTPANAVETSKTGAIGLPFVSTNSMIMIIELRVLKQ